MIYARNAKAFASQTISPACASITTNRKTDLERLLVSRLGGLCPRRGAKIWQLVTLKRGCG